MSKRGVVINGEFIEYCDRGVQPTADDPLVLPIRPFLFRLGEVVWVKCTISGARVRARVLALPYPEERIHYRLARLDVDNRIIGATKPAREEQLSGYCRVEGNATGPQTGLRRAIKRHGKP